MSISTKNWVVMPVGRSAVAHFVSEHYLHKWPGVVVATLGLVDGDRCIGCCIFALPPRETMKRYGVDSAWELARLYCMDDTPKNTETWFVSRCIRWISRNRPDVKVLVSYADPSVGHQGIIYQAGNWISDGRTDQERVTPRFDYRDPEPPSQIQAALYPDMVNKKHRIFSRKKHVPDGLQVERVPRISKRRYVYWLDGKHEERRVASMAEAKDRLRGN